MKQMWKRMVAVLLAVLLLGTMTDFSGLATVAKAVDGTETPALMDGLYKMTIGDGNTTYLVCADQNLGSNVPLYANREASGASVGQGSWEGIRIEANPDGTYSLRASNDKYVTVGADSCLEASAADNSETASRFTIEKAGGNRQYVLVSVANGKAVQTDFNNGGQLKAVKERSEANSWEFFRLNRVDLGVLPVYFYVAQDPDGVWTQGANLVNEGEAWPGTAMTAVTEPVAGRTGWLTRSIERTPNSSNLLWLNTVDPTYMNMDGYQYRCAKEIYAEAQYVIGDERGFHNFATEEEAAAYLAELEEASHRIQIDESKLNVFFYAASGTNTVWRNGANLADWTRSSDWPGEPMTAIEDTICGRTGWQYQKVEKNTGKMKFSSQNGTFTNDTAYQAEFDKVTGGCCQYVIYDNGTFQSFASEAEAAAYLNAREPAAGDGMTVHYYAGTAKTSAANGADLTTGWESAEATVFYYEAGTTNKKVVSDNVYARDDNGWITVNTGLDPQDPALENGVYVTFAGPDGTATAAYQFLNDKRVWVTSEMTMFWTPEEAIASLQDQELSDPVPDGMIRIWFARPSSWKSSYVFYGSSSEDPNLANNYAQEVAQQAYVDGAAGITWCYADVPCSRASVIYFDENTVPNDGSKATEVYDISSRSCANEIFCAENTRVLVDGWSTSTAGIVKYYDLANAPDSNEISLPLTVLDYNADNLFFEYDMYWLRNMTMVLGNERGKYNMQNMGIGDSTSQWPTIYEAGKRPGSAVHYDRNNMEYVSDVLAPYLSADGYPVYTDTAISYIANVAYRGFCYYQGDLAGGFIQPYNKTALFDTVYSHVVKNGSVVLGDLAATKAKYASKKASEWDIEDVESCMDYAYYVMQNLYDPESTYNHDYKMYSYLVLQKTSPNVYGFYANYETSLPTAENLDQNYTVVYDPYTYTNTDGTLAKTGGSGTIRNIIGEGTLSDKNEGYLLDGQSEMRDFFGSVVYVKEGYCGVFPYSKEWIDRAYGNGTEEAGLRDLARTSARGNAGYDQEGYPKEQRNDYYYYTYPGMEEPVEYIEGDLYVPEVSTTGYTKKLNNYNYAMKMSGKFRYNQADDLYFTFTGDDDVVLFINGVKVLDLSGAHHAASYTVYLNDMVINHQTDIQMQDGEYYTLDFFYMERHTDWSNMRIESNIDVIDVSSQVEKTAYRADGSKIPSGTALEENTPVTFGYDLTVADSDGVKDLSFTDPSLGVAISKDQIILGTYVDETGAVQERKISDLTVTINGVTYTQDNGLTDDAAGEAFLKELLAEGVQAGKSISVEGIRYVMHTGVTGAVVARMTGESDGRALSSADQETLYVNKPSISVTEAAYDTNGILYPNNNTLQSGAPAMYTITLSNTGNEVVTGISLVDEKLGFSFKAGDAYINHRGVGDTKYEELTITVSGTGITDGVYKVNDQAELEILAAKLSKIAFPTGATLEVSGIRQQITGTFPTEVTGEAVGLVNYGLDTDAGFAAYGVAYKAYLEAKEAYDTASAEEQAGMAEPAAPAWTDYVSSAVEEGTLAVYEAYVAGYEQMIRELKGNGGDLKGVTIPDLQNVTGNGAGFTLDQTPLRDTADYVLNAKVSHYLYYTQAGQEIDIALGDSIPSVVLEKSGTWGEEDTAVEQQLGTVDWSEGSHTVAIYLDEKLKEDHSGNGNTNAGVNIYQVILRRQNPQPGEQAAWIFDYDTTGNLFYDKNGNVIETYRLGETSGVARDGETPVMVLQNQGDTLLVSAADLPEDTYEVAVCYIAATNPVRVSVLTDRTPGDCILTDAAGTPLEKAAEDTASQTITYQIDQATVVVDNSAAYAALSYTNETAGVETIGVRLQNAADTVKPDGVTVKTYDVQDDVYVLDYGLDVSLRAADTNNDNGLFLNDAIQTSAEETAVFAGVRAVAEKIDRRAVDAEGHGTYTYRYDNEFTPVYGTEAKRMGTDEAGDPVQLSYGTVTASAAMAPLTADLDVTYHLDGFLEGIDRYAYGVQVSANGAVEKNVTNSTPVMEANVTIMPASIVYYEDNFTASIFANGTVEGTPENELQNNSLKTQYGYDQAYRTDTAASNGTYTALASNQSVAFTFQGTGFDILSRTSNANLYVAVYDARDYELKGYTYGSAGNTIYYAVKKTADAAGPMDTAYINAYNENQQIHHIPLISMDLKTFGKYLVIATKTTGTDALYVDGIRIYDPLGTKADVKADAEQEAAYRNAAGELDAVVLDIRSTILGTDYQFVEGAAQDPNHYVDADGNEKQTHSIASLAKMEGSKLYLTQGSTVVESYTGSIDSGAIAKLEDGSADTMDKADHTSSLLAYAVSGPNNELYLTDPQYVYATVLDGVLDGATVQIGMKAVQGKADVEYLSNDTKIVLDPETGAEQTEQVWKPLVSGLETATEMYYRVDLSDLKEADGKKVLVVRAKNAGTEEYILSLTNLKYSSQLLLQKPSAGDLVAEETATEDETYAGTFEVLSNTSGTKKSVVTISVPSEVTEFTIVQKAEEGTDAEDTVILTYSEERGTLYAAEGVKLSYRGVGDGKIFVLQFTGSEWHGHTFQTTTLANKIENGQIYYYKNASFVLE